MNESNVVKDKEDIINIVDLYKSFDKQKVLNGVSLDVYKNETLCIIGGSGCGKSVLLKHLLGLLKPDAGSIYMDGTDICTLDEYSIAKFRSKFGMVFQGSALFDSLNVFDNVSFGLVKSGEKSKSVIADKVNDVLKRVGLPGIEHKRIAELSGGMRKRVGLARSIAMDPEILLYDEPTTGLDPIMSRVIDDLIVKLSNDLDITSIVVTHDMQSVINVAHRVVMLNEGNLIHAGSIENLHRVEDEYIKQFVEGRSDGPIDVNI